MSINKSEEFVYFQNKAKHYDNIKKAKPTVKDQLQSSYRHTINHDNQKKKSISPYLKQYEIKVENDHLINRIVNISKSKRTEVSVQGNYSRFHRVQRNFRTKHPYDEQCKRKIGIQNEEMVSRIEGVKPAVGTNSAWTTQYHKSLSHRRNLSRYLDGQKSKGQLHISTQKFMPQHYRSFIFKNEQLDSAQAPNTIAILPRQKLIQLPKIRYNKSKSVLNTERSRETLQI